jgi:hypothetical protein
MKTFDLTFEGTVRHGFDRQQIKMDLARLFCIEDPDIVNQLFCGKVILLRSGLDRKDAADYFSKISRLGSKATLSESGEKLPHKKTVGLELKRFDNGPPQLVSPCPVSNTDADELELECKSTDKIWPFSAARNLQRHTESVAEAVSKPKPAVSPDLEIKLGTATVLPTADIAKSQRELDELRTTIEKTQRESQKEASKTLRRKNQFERIAAEELSKIDVDKQENQHSSQTRITQLKLSEKKMRKVAETELAQLEAQEDHTRKRVAAEADKLQHLIDDKNVAAQNEFDELGRETTEVRNKAAAEITLLQQKILDVQTQADTNSAQLGRRLRQVEFRTRTEVDAWQKQKDDIDKSACEDLEKLQQQQTDAELRLNKATTSLQQQRQDIQRDQDVELSRLEAVKQDITRKRQEGVANTVKANKTFRLWAKEELLRMKIQQEKLERLLRRASTVTYTETNLSSGEEKTGQAANSQQTF